MTGIFRREKGDYRRLAAIAMPMVLQNLVSSLVGFTDTAMVGILGQTELSGMSQANIVFFISALFVFGIMSGSSVLISQYWGRGDKKTISRVVGIGTYCTFIVTMLFATTVTIFPYQIMGITTNDPELIEVAVRYGRIVAFSYVFDGLTMTYVGAQRSVENPSYGMKILTFTCLLNTGLNYVLIFGKLGMPRMGIEGAAVATVIARGAGLLVTVFHAVKLDKRLDLDFKQMLKPGKIITRDFFRFSLPVVLNETVFGIGTSLYSVIFGHMLNSSDVVAAYSVSGNIERIVTILTFALANATAVMVGKAIGEGKSYDEVRRLASWLIAISLVSGAASGILLVLINLLLCKSFLFPLFSLTANASRIAFIMMFVLAGIMVMRNYSSILIVGVLRGGGDTKFGMLMDVGSMYIYAIPVVAVTGLILHWDPGIVYLLMAGDEVIKSMIGMFRYRSGKWMRNVTRDMT